MSSEQDFKQIIERSLNNVNRETRQKLSEVLKDPLFTPVYDLSIRNQKELALKRLKKVCEAKIVSVRDFTKDPENIFTVHEMVIL
jgi:acyl-CoA oxidase